MGERRISDVETKVVLAVRNVDLDDDATIEKLALTLADLGWQEEGGQVTATVFVEQGDPVAVALAAAQTIVKVLPGALVERADEQFVSTADIAARTSLSHEAVRLWATGKRRSADTAFPPPRAVVGQGNKALKIWAWPDVLDWLRSKYRIDPEPGIAYLDPAQTARLNGLLADSATRGRHQWRQVTDASFVMRTLNLVDDCLHDNGITTRRTTTRHTLVVHS